MTRQTSIAWSLATALALSVSCGEPAPTAASPSTEQRAAWASEVLTALERVFQSFPVLATQDALWTSMVGFSGILQARSELREAVVMAFQSRGLAATPLTLAAKDARFFGLVDEVWGP